jgi:hypothetical protein
MRRSHIFKYLILNFPEKLPQGKVFPAGPNQKKEKIGTIFCPKGGLAVVKLPQGKLFLFKVSCTCTLAADFPCGKNNVFNFPEKTTARESFSGPLGLVTSAQREALR